MANEGEQVPNANIFKPLQELNPATNGHQTDLQTRFENIFIIHDVTTTQKDGPGTLVLNETEAVWQSTGDTTGPNPWRVRFDDVNLHAIGTHNESGHQDDEDENGRYDDHEDEDDDANVATCDDKQDKHGDEGATDSGTAGDGVENGAGYMLVQLGDDCHEVRLVGMDEQSLWAMYSSFCDAVARCTCTSDSDDGQLQNGGTSSAHNELFAGFDTLLSEHGGREDIEKTGEDNNNAGSGDDIGDGENGNRENDRDDDVDEAFTNERWIDAEEGDQGEDAHAAHSKK